MDTYKVIGLMSGTSMDGVDLAYCEFVSDKSWKYQIIFAETLSYPQLWKDMLTNLINSPEDDIEIANIEYGKYLGLLINDFIRKYDASPDFISSHGHTIFHQPEKGITVQIGDGRAISDIIRLPVVYNFRALDVQLGGQGAPLVPVGDSLLFSEYKYCLNFGGIANISYKYQESRIAFDICPVNMVLNHYSEKLGFEYDHNGQLAQSGNLNTELLDQLNKLDYYQQSPPKSLGREWVDTNIFPLIDDFKLEPIDVLKTFTKHIVFQINSVLIDLQKGQILITGGGARNTYLIEQLQKAVDMEIVIPDEVLIDYKEALVFAFLGVLRWRNEVNCLASVTGASQDSSGGVIIKKKGEV
ncbi:MAG: anhydro-N-acetylmuramic acid kinase [Bacteroidales bacterium]|nr:anhydro-N-acetylmuramic acid kinase [Bacteroidales bacterium]